MSKLWEIQKRDLRNYSRRHQERSNLYRLIYHYREEFEYSWEDLFVSKYGVLREEVLRSLDEYLNCGILSSGCAIARCNYCNHSTLIAYSCKKRCLCPSCDAKRAHIFGEYVVENILYENVSHSHIVFTIPKRLRVYFKYDRTLLKHLYLSAWKSLKELILSNFEDSVDYKPGAIMSLHTSGNLLNFHPHLHVLLLNGAVNSEGVVEELDLLSSKELELLFSSKLYSRLEKSGLVDSKVIEEMKSWEHSGFNIWVGEGKTVLSNKEDLLFLSRYLKRCPIDLGSIEIEEGIGNPKVIYSSSFSDKVESKKFEVLEFIAELSQHIPDKWEQTTRYYGVYSARTKGKIAKDALEELEIEESLEKDILSQDRDKKAVNKSWAMCMKKVFEIDPLICPKCSGEMKIVAFIQDLKEIKRIAENLGETVWRAPPSFNRNSTNNEIELVYDT